MLPSHIRAHLFSRKLLVKPFSSSSSSLSKSASPPSSSLLPVACSPQHDSLRTYLAHAHETEIKQNSTVFIGTYYEYICLHTLPKLGFHDLRRTGGRDDLGVDLVGQWKLPSLPYPLRVFVQCKTTKTGPLPQRVREMEGAMSGAPEGWRGANTVGVMCGNQAATKGVREAVRRCGIPLVWVMIQEEGIEKRTGKGRVRQVLWNEKVAAIGAEGVSVGARYEVSHREKIETTEKEAVLLWEGREWRPDLKAEEEKVTG